MTEGRHRVFGTGPFSSGCVLCVRVEIFVERLGSTLIEYIRRRAFPHARLDAHHRAPPLLTVGRFRPHHRLGWHSASPQWFS